MFKKLKIFGVASFWILAWISVINFTYPISHKHQPPIIATFSQECPKYKSKIDIDICPPGSSYLPHSYVKFIEESGGEVLILPTYTTNEQLKNLIFQRQISGILLPGGGQFKWEYYRLARKAVRLVLDYEIEMPIFGICHGFELMLVEASEPNGNTRETHRAKLLERISGTESVGLEVKFSDSSENLSNSKMFKNLPEFLKSSMENLPITMNAHRNTVFEDTFKRLAKNDLNDFIITSTSTSPDLSFKDRPFVASAEHKKLPLFSVQYHPEKANFEKTKINNDVDDSSKTSMIHSLEAIQVSQYLGDYFVEKCGNFQAKTLKIFGESKLPSGYEPFKAKYHKVILPKIGSKMWKHYNSIYLFGEKI